MTGNHGGGGVSTRTQEPDNPAAGQLDSTASEINGFLSEVTGVEDPLSMLVGTGVEFVIDFVPFVQDAIQLVTGDGPALEASAEQFSQLNQASEELAKQIADTFDSQLDAWQGDAAEAERDKLANFVEGVKNTGLQAHNVSELLKMSAVMMQAAEDVIKGILADFLTWAIVTWITALATAGPTFGGSTAAAGAATTAEAAVTTTRATTQVERITKIIDTIQTVIEAIQSVIDAVRIVDSVQTITSGTGDEQSGDGLATAKDKLGETGDQLGDVKDSLNEGAEEDGGHENAGSTTDGQSQSVSERSGTTDSDGSSTSGTDDGTSTTNGAEEDSGSNKFDLKGSALGHGQEELGNAADKLQEQAQGGGFSQVPADETISGQLDW